MHISGDMFTSDGRKEKCASFCIMSDCVINSDFLRSQNKRLPAKGQDMKKQVRSSRLSPLLHRTSAAPLVVLCPSEFQLIFWNKCQVMERSFTQLT